MRVERGASQILFGLLPGQTADLEGRIWRVTSWVDPVQTPLDQDAVRSALISAIAPWTVTGMDDGLTAELRARTTVEVVRLNMDRGVLVESFPQQWRCKTCGTITRSRDDRCPCGGRNRAQMQFIAYHTCGAARQPMLPGCRTNALAVRLPARDGTDLRFRALLQHHVEPGIPLSAMRVRQRRMSLTVHRAPSCSPPFRGPSEPADPAVAAGSGPVEEEHGRSNGSRGMGPDDPTAGRQTLAGLIDTSPRVSPTTAEELARQAAERGEVDVAGATSSCSPTSPREGARRGAQSRLGRSGGRTRVADMVAGTTPPLRTLYEGAYGDAMRAARLDGVDLLANFPVATLAFGYTRGDMNPGVARLVPFRDRGHIRAYGALSRTEALLFRLDPLAVHRHLVEHGHHLPPAPDARAARLRLLERMDIPWPTQEQVQPLGGDLLTLLHSYAHRTIRRLAAFAGIERDGLAEYLVPHHLAFVVYAASRGDFVLGGLQAVFETSLHRFLDDFVSGESRCALDPGCRSGGGACMACLHLGEPSCRWFNRFLDRSQLFGERGFIRNAG